MSASKIVSVRKAVVAAVDGLSAFADVEVMYAYRDKGLREFAYTRDATFNHEPQALTAGRNIRAEVGRFELVVWIELVGGTPEDAADRAMTLGLAVEEWVADHKQGVGGARVLLVDGSGSIKEAAGDQSSYAELVLPIRFNARLT